MPIVIDVVAVGTETAPDRTWARVMSVPPWAQTSCPSRWASPVQTLVGAALDRVIA